MNCEKLLKENEILQNNKLHYSENDVEIIKMYETKTCEASQKFLNEIDNLNQKVILRKFFNIF